MNIKKYNKLCLDEAQKHQLTLSNFDVWNNGYSIGIDDKAKTLFYHLEKSDENITHVIQLDSISSCKSVTDKDKSNNTQKLSLLIRFKDANKPSVSLEFYNVKYRSSLFTEIPLLEKWDKLVSRALKK
ncbi:MAG: hypothetical protein WC967_01060 [Balneolaceae bacterium]